MGARNEKAFDVVVVGAGSAGAATAFHMAREGKRVALLERGAVEKAGARWVNGGAPWMFDRACIDRPLPPERRGPADAFVMLDAAGRHRVPIRPNPTFPIDMRLLVRRLQRMAVSAGVSVFSHTKPRMLLHEDGRPTLLKASTSEPGRAPADITFRAALFVDASGHAAVLRKRAPALEMCCPKLTRRDLCSAAQQVRRIADDKGARRFLERFGSEERQALSFLAVDGGYSTTVIQVDLAERQVEILTGACAESGHRSGTALLQDFVSRESWVGKPLFGGSGVIPLRRPYERLAAPGIALVGDSACQVFPAHGSGVATGLIAARILAETAGRADDAGSLEATWSYAAAYMREVGAVSASYDVFRRLSQRLTADEVAEMMAAGLMSPTLGAAGLAQQLPRLPVGEIPRVLKGALQAPGMARKLAPTVAKMYAVYGHYKRYPLMPDVARFHRWNGITSRLFNVSEVATNTEDLAA
jgi:menaquinone-9 beta-reductase